VGRREKGFRRTPRLTRIGRRGEILRRGKEKMEVRWDTQPVKIRAMSLQQKFTTLANAWKKEVRKTGTKGGRFLEKHEKSF